MSVVNAPPTAVWQFDDFILDTSCYELRRGAEVVRMEPQVFDVLVRLVTHHHRCVTKVELFESVWGVDIWVGSPTN